MVKKRLKIRPLLVTLNILVLLIIVGFYAFRLVKYYKKENGGKSNSDILLVDEIVKKQSFVDLTKGLVYDEKENVYRYIGDIKDNYLEFSGNLFRIIEVDADYNIKAVSEKSFTYMYSGLEKGFNDSYLNEWLNELDSDNSGVFERNLYNTDPLFYTTVCEDVISDVTNITCDKKNKENRIGILSLYEYAKSGGKSGFLNNGEIFYLTNLNDKGSNYYVTSDGEISISELTTKAFGVRPVITISGDTSLLSGKGTINNPYRIEKHEIQKVKDLYIGNIITIDDLNYVVVDVSGENVKVALNDTLKTKDDDTLLKAFGGNNSIYSNNKNTVGHYLNNDFYNSLSNKEIIAKSDWYIGKLSLDKLDYSGVYSSKVALNVGMLTLGDMFINDVKNVFTLFRGIEDNKIIYVINEDGNFYGDFISSKYEVRPAFYIKGDTLINGGAGTEEEPYELGDSNEETES